MSFYLAVWRSPAAISDSEAASRYQSLNRDRTTPPSFDFQVYTFYSLLTALYPELELVPESEIDTCPWACAIDMSGSHVILAIRPEAFEEVAPQVRALAEEHDLVCFDPQAGKVHLPPFQRVQQASAA